MDPSPDLSPVRPLFEGTEGADTERVDTEEPTMNDQPTTVKVGDLVVVPEYDGPNNVGTVTQIAEDENGWPYARVEVDGVVIWEEVAHFRPVDPSEIETDEDF